MKVKVLGTRGEIEPTLPYHRYHSGVLIDGTIMLDLGEEKFLKYQPKHIFITHLHPDHAFFVRGRVDFTTPVYAPDKRVENVRVLAHEITLDGYRVTPVPTHHSKVASSQAYIVSHIDQRVLYTGDIAWINKEHHHLFRNLNLVITDGSIMRKGGRILRDKETGQLYGHAGIPKLIELFGDFTRCILFVHFGSWFYEGVKEARAKLEKLGEEAGVKVLVGYDGMEIDVSALR